ncbi:MAG TPA: hypothetical protein PL161_07600, partial [Spirochaetota bacterium]|nr:hypothetical protein [Spirochaetota bacterium]
YLINHILGGKVPIFFKKCPRDGHTSKDFVFGIHYLHGSCNNIKRCFTPFKSGFAWSHAIRSKGTGLQSPALSLLKSLPALCRAELAEPLSADSAQTEPCAPIRDKFAFGKFCFFLIIHLSLALTRYGDS